MSASTALIVFILAIIVTIVLSELLKVNIGIIGLLMAYVLGIVFSHMNAGQIASFFPGSIFLTQLSITFFFGFAVEAGIFKGIGDRVIYRCRKAMWAIPIITMLAGLVVGALGAGNEATPLVISPLAFAFAAEAGFNPILAALATYCGSCWAGAMPWTSGAIFFGFATTAIGDDGNIAMWAALIQIFVVFMVMFFVSYFIFKGHRINKSSVNISVPEPFTQKQKTVLRIVIIAILFMILPSLLSTFVPSSAFLKTAKSICDIRLICLIGSVVCMILKVSTGREILAKRVPWGLLTMLAGMCTFMSVAGSLGIVDLLANWISNEVPLALVPACFVLLGGLLSFITNGITIYPLFTGMVPAMAAASGLSPIFFCACVMTGCFPSGFSPISTGGVMAVIGASDEVKTQIWWKQMGIALFGVVINVLLTLVGFTQLIVNILT